MSDATRRGFLKSSATGAAAVGIAAVASGALATDATAASREDASLPKGAKGSIVVHIEDVHSGRLSLMIEGHEVTITDHVLVARITHALHAAAAASV